MFQRPEILLKPGVGRETAEPKNSSFPYNARRIYGRMFQRPEILLKPGVGRETAELIIGGTL